MQKPSVGVAGTWPKLKKIRKISITKIKSNKYLYPLVPSISSLKWLKYVCKQIFWLLLFEEILVAPMKYLPVQCITIPTDFQTHDKDSDKPFSCTPN
jgi:hypothetical protein